MPIPALRDNSAMATPLPPDEPIRYMQRTRDWYLALGYGNPYRWAHFTDVPFQPLTKPLAQCTVALVTTSAPAGAAPAKAGAQFNAAAKFFRLYSGDTDRDHDVRNTHVAIDFRHTTCEDSNTWFPLPLMRNCAAQGQFALARRFHGMPTNRSQRHTMEVDCPELLARCREDGVDAAVLVPNCPVCHQTMSLAARHLEANGIATVVMGCAKDIVEHCGVPRLVFSDFPLGNSAGKPRDRGSQELTLQLALRTLQSAPAARTTVQSPLRWSESPEWKLDYSNPERASPEEVARARQEMDEGKALAKQIRASTL
jgi:hypothetical protein